MTIIIFNKYYTFNYIKGTGVLPKVKAMNLLNNIRLHIAKVIPNRYVFIVKLKVIYISILAIDYVP